ncbi:MAG: class I SAM-dependent methyltransferase, partial [Acidimicrobiia bacterium]
TTRHLRALGVASGWRCLEAGAGGGSIAAFLSRQVGPQGSVTAVDIDTRFVQEIDAGNLDVVEADITATDLPRHAFDLVHCRALLMHLPARERVLDMFVTALRPGGWLLIEEGDSAPLPATGSSPDADVLRAVVVDGLTAAGVDWTFAHRLPESLQQRGLRDVGAESDVQVYEGGSPMAELLRLTVDQLRAGGLTSEALEDRIDAWSTVVRQPGHWFHSFGLVSAWGRRAG